MKLLKFYANWCQPCKQFSPIVDTVTNRLNVTLSSINIETDEAAVKQYNIVGLPTIILMDDDGNELGKQTGKMTESQLEEWIKSF